MEQRKFITKVKLLERHLIKKINHITKKRIANANFFDEKLIDEVVTEI